MRVGISTACFFPMLTEQALAVLLGLGCRTLEVFVNSPSECGPDYARALGDAARAAGGSIVALHPYSSGYEGFSFFGRYERRFFDGLEEYRRVFEACRIMGGEVVAFHGARLGFSVEESLYVERYARLDELARSFGVQLCHENVVGFRLESVEAVTRLRRALPGIGFLFDNKQALRSGVDPLEMLAAMGQNLRHVHLSDHDDRHDCLTPGQGEADLPGLMAALAALGYDREVIIEVYRGSFSDPQELRIAENYMNKILRTP